MDGYDPPVPGAARVDALRVAADAPVRHRDLVVVEEPLEIRIAGDALAVTMRTPGHDHELALGFLLSEGIITSRLDVGTIAHCGHAGDEGYGNTIDVAPAPGTVLDPERTAASRRGSLTTSSCGVCGRRSVEDLVARAGRITDPTVFPRELLAGLADRLRDKQDNFRHTGGIHAAGIVTSTGEWLAIREDVGRHNAVDKVVGRLLLDDRLPARGTALVISGRSSFEIVQKALVAGIPLVLGVSAPSSLAVRTAANAGMTLIGFAREGAFNVYSGAGRVGG